MNARRKPKRCKGGANFVNTPDGPRKPVLGDGFRKAIRPGNLPVPGPYVGVGVRHALFPGGTLLGALAFAGRVLPDATVRGMRMYRSHGGTVPIVSVRNLSSEVFSPGSVASCRKLRAGRGADTPAIGSRVGTVAAGTAPACGRTLAPRYGSDLLPLRLRWGLQWGDPALRDRLVEEVGGLCQARSLPAIASSLRARPVRAGGAFWRGPAEKRDCVLVCAVATGTLWVTASAHGSKLPMGLTRLGRGF